MQKWEYHIEHTYIFEGDGVDDFREEAKRLGQRGWELFSVDNGIAYFKRPIEFHLSSRITYKTQRELTDVIGE